jgi:hypothetical protein
MCGINPTPPIGGGATPPADPTQAKGTTPTTPPAPTQLPAQTTGATTGAVAGATGGGETAPAATAVAGAANLDALAPVLQQLVSVLQQLVTAIQAMNVTGGGAQPPIKGEGTASQAARRGG